jgi:DeoR/GlpR family transcriptional regulator of sugar metabolism
MRLDAEGRVLRLRGGAVLPPVARQVENYSKREQPSTAKQSIGAAAARLIHAGERVLFDTSTTVLEVARAIRVSPLSVLTNSIDVADVLSKTEGVELHVLGGRFNAWQRSLEGSQARQGLAHFRVDKLLLGVCGMDPSGLTCTSEEEASLKHAMMDQATQVIMLAEGSKFHRSYLHRLCGFDRIDVLVTDQQPPGAVAGALVTLGVEVIVAGPERAAVAANG